MVEIPQAAAEVITSGALAHLVTINRDGSPQVTCVWTGIEGGEIVIGHLNLHQKIKNVRREPRVALSWETGRAGGLGLEEYLVVHGEARVTEGGAPQLLQQLAHVYIGPDVTFPPMPNPPPGYVMRILPQRFGGNGPWVSAAG